MGCFPTTQWGTVLAAGKGDGGDGRGALEALCSAYWPPVYAFVRRRGQTPSDAEDLTQSFFARFYEKGYVHDFRGQLVKWKDGALAATMSDAQWEAVVGVNLKGVFLCTRAVVPHMIAAGGGVVLNASSVVGLYGNFGQTNYVATKAGVIGMTKTWTRELGRYKIRVNAVAPGFVAAEMVKAMPERVLSAMVEHTPIGRMGQPDDIADAYVWLASDRAGFVHGAVISVDGGIVTGT